MPIWLDLSSALHPSLSTGHRLRRIDLLTFAQAGCSMLYSPVRFLIHSAMVPTRRTFLKGQHSMGMR